MIRKAIDLILDIPEHILELLRIQFIGEIHLLPNDIIEKCNKLSKWNGNFTVNIAIAYDPIEDSKRFLNNVTFIEKQIIKKILNNEAYVSQTDKSGFYCSITTRKEKTEYITKILNKEVFINKKQNLMYVKK